MNPIVIILSTTLIASSAIANEFSLTRRAVQVEIGTACQYLDDGQSMEFIKEQLVQNLKERGLTQLQINQASKTILKLIKRECN